MADLAFGLSKAVIELLADKFNKAIKEDAKQWQTVQRDLVFITGEFEMMESFLDTATEEHVKNKIVRTWVRQVRNLSYDVEDCIDFVIQILDTPKRSSRQLRLLQSCTCSCGKTREPLPVDHAVAQTTLLRARVVDVSKRNIRYNLLVDSASKPMASMDLAPVQKTDASSFDSLIYAVKKSGPLDLAGLIAMKDRDLHVVSVSGAEGDLVKVAIVSKMYNDARFQKDIQCRAWVKLMHPFNPHEFLQSLMTQFFMHSCQEQEEVIVGIDALVRMQATQGDLDLMNEFTKKINTHRYLIVLEDLCTIVQWNAIKFYLPDRKRGSRIVVLTHHPVVASQCTGQPCRFLELSQCSPGHSVRVYYKEGFPHYRDYSLKGSEPYHSSVKCGLVGRDNELAELSQKAYESRLISVWGMPGVGKSALVKTLYDYLTTSNEFKRHVWISVSYPFNPSYFCQSLLANLEEKCGKKFQAENPIEECQYHLREGVDLFVIDGVQSNQEWDWIKSNLILKEDSIRCTIVITSEESVAKHCAVSIDGVYNIKGLQHFTDASNLFEKALGEEGWFLKLKENEEEEKDAKLFLSKCGGLPRVLITVARYLASKPKDMIQQEMRRLSDNFLHELMSNPEFDALRGLLAWMHSYLDACPRHLKKFMLYLSIFPQDTNIRRRSLIRRWIAEGYSKGTDSISTEKYAEKIFDEVATLSIMQPVEAAGKVIGYQVNGFFREYILSRPEEETVFFPVEVSATEKLGHGHGRLATNGIGQHLAVWSTWLIDQVLFESLDFSRLRSLTVFTWFWSFYVSDRMRVLRVLDLENASGGVSDSYFEEIGKLPSRLKFLSLRGQRGIFRVPDSVAELEQLQTLDIRGTEIRTLPPFITRLQKLQYIRAGTTVAWTDEKEEEEGSTPPSSSRWRTLASCLPNKFLRRPVVGSCNGGVVVPRGINRLQALQTLGAVCVNTTDGEAILDEIVYDLPQLKKLEISGISGKHTLGAFAFLDIKKHLESLTLQLEENNHFEDIFCFPYSLRSLKMYGHVEQLPSLIKYLPNLVKLTLHMTTLFTAEVREELGSIQNLQTLRLRINKDQDGGLELQFPGAELFRKLQVLEIASKSKLHLTFDEGAVQKLEHLKLHCLEGSEMQVSGLERLVSLKQVWLLRSFNDALKEAVQQQIDKHPKIPALRLEVRPRSSEATSSSQA